MKDPSNWGLRILLLPPAQLIKTAHVDRLPREQFFTEATGRPPTSRRLRPHQAPFLAWALRGPKGEARSWADPETRGGGREGSPTYCRSRAPHRSQPKSFQEQSLGCRATSRPTRTPPPTQPQPNPSPQLQGPQLASTLTPPRPASAFRLVGENASSHEASRGRNTGATVR